MKPEPLTKFAHCSEIAEHLELLHQGKLRNGDNRLDGWKYNDYFELLLDIGQPFLAFEPLPLEI